MKRLVRVSLWAALSLAALTGVGAGSAWWYFHPAVQRTDCIPYGQRGDRVLTLDVMQPGRPNGAGVLLLVSGGWKSRPCGSCPLWLPAPFLRRGYAVFAIYHLSQPKATVMEIIEDIHRAARFVRHHARDYGVDPQRLGVTGASAGGHLSLMLATRGGPGPAGAPDPVDRESSAVQAVAIFFPVTDLLNLGKSRENAGDGGPPRSYRAAFGPQAANLADWRVIGRECSPIYHIPPGLPPIFILHGDADPVTPLEQSEWFQSRAREQGHEVRIAVHRGGGHGWWTAALDILRFADWFDRHLLETGRGN